LTFRRYPCISAGKTILKHAIKEKILEEVDRTEACKKDRGKEARQVASGKETQEVHGKTANEEGSKAR